VRPDRTVAATAAALFLAGVLLNAPLFMPGEMPYRDSIEGGYASMTRFIAAHPGAWGWNPLQYGGLRTQFTYLPLSMYTGAALSWLTGLAPEYAHRLVAAAFACLGPVTLFLFVWYFTRSKVWSGAAAAAYILVCPLYGLTQVISNDRGYVQLPWRLQVLAKYGEGPHNIGLALIPLALMASWAAAASHRYRNLFLAALLMAAVALTNWIAALALAICCLLLMLAGFRTPGFRAHRVILAALIGYLLACFWLTPSFIYTIAFNWPFDAFNFKLQQRQWLMMAGLLAGVLCIRVALWRWRDAYLNFVMMAVFAFGWIALGFYWFRLDTIPESRRYALEFSLFLFVAGFELLRRLWNTGRRPIRAAAAVAAIAVFSLGFGQARLYLTQGWLRWWPAPKERTVEYRLARWLADHQPRGRVFASGGVRFRLNSWFSIPQVGGTFESGLRNRLPMHFTYQIRTGLGSKPETEGADALLQLQTMGVEYVVVNGPGSKEHYRDIKNYAKFDGVLERVYGEEHDWIYRVPFRSYAHLVRREELAPDIPDGYHVEVLKPYVVAAAQRPLAAEWRSPNLLAISGAVESGMLITVKVNYDIGWEATQNGRPIEIEKDGLGYMLLHPRAEADARIELRYAGTPEQRGFAVISLIAWMAALVRLWRSERLHHTRADVEAERLASA
jgi:hypothetical protein